LRPNCTRIIEIKNSFEDLEKNMFEISFLKGAFSELLVALNVDLSHFLMNYPNCLEIK
jgi:hypothetical protein